METYPEKTEIPHIQAPLPPPGVGFIPPSFEAVPPPPYAPTVIVRDINQCYTCQNGTYELQWNGWMIFLIILIALMFFPLGIFACICFPAAREIRCNNCQAKKPELIVVQHV